MIKGVQSWDQEKSAREHSAGVLGLVYLCSFRILVDVSDVKTVLHVVGILFTFSKHMLLLSRRKKGRIIQS